MLIFVIMDVIFKKVFVIFVKIYFVYIDSGIWYKFCIFYVINDIIVRFVRFFFLDIVWFLDENFE